MQTGLPHGAHILTSNRVERFEANRQPMLIRTLKQLSDNPIFHGVHFVEPLTKEELDCLKRIEAQLDCSETVAEMLVGKRLVEQGRGVILPQLPQGFGERRYRLTEAGRKALDTA